MSLCCSHGFVSALQWSLSWGERSAGCRSTEKQGSSLSAVSLLWPFSHSSDQHIIFIIMHFHGNYRSLLSCDRGFIFSLTPSCLIYIEQQNVWCRHCAAILQKTFNFTIRLPLISCPSSCSAPGVVFHPHPWRPRLSSLSGARVYERVKQMREDERRKRTMLCDVLHYIHDGRACQQWLSKQAAMWVCNSGAVKVALPADLHHRAGKLGWRKEEA